MLTNLSRLILAWATRALGRTVSDSAERAPLQLAAALRQVAESSLVTNASESSPARTGAPLLRLVSSDGVLVERRDIHVTGVAAGLPPLADSEHREPLAGAASFLAGRGARLYSLDAFRGARPGRTPHAA